MWATSLNRLVTTTRRKLYTGLVRSGWTNTTLSVPSSRSAAVGIATVSLGAGGSIVAVTNWLERRYPFSLLTQPIMMAVCCVGSMSGLMASICPVAGASVGSVEKMIF